MVKVLALGIVVVVVDLDVDDPGPVANPVVVCCILPDLVTRAPIRSAGVAVGDFSSFLELLIIILRP